MFQGLGMLMEGLTESSIEAEVLTPLPPVSDAGCVWMSENEALTVHLQAGQLLQWSPCVES